MNDHTFVDPGDLLMVQERDRHLARIVQQNGHRTLAGVRVFEAGCGAGYNLRQAVQWGADAADVAGIDISEKRIREIHKRSPGIRTHVGSAEHIPEPDHWFDISLAFTLFSSIGDEEVTARIAGEMFRVTKPGGLIIIYDVRRRSPGNRAVHPVDNDDIQRWFPKCRVRTRHITLAPPLARKIGRFAPFLYGPLATIPLLRTHSLHVMRRPALSPFDTSA